LIEDFRLLISDFVGMKFVADVMLGSLAKAMRFCGYDVTYNNEADDESLKKQARHRLLLTKDQPLASQLPERCVYLVEGIGTRHQLDEIRLKFPMKNRMPRCMECNGRLKKIRKSKVRHLVPPFVWKKQECFFQCSRCSQIYWRGTHYQNMLRMLE
jgi:uncharacterized protein with PIN domain